MENRKSSNISDISFEHAASIHTKNIMTFKPSYPAIYRITLSDNDECRSRSFINYVKLVDREKNDYEVRIDTSCEKCSVSIHPECRRLVEFSTCSKLVSAFDVELC